MIKSKIRQIIRNNIVLYKVWLFFKDGYKYKLPDKNTDLHLTGFQRSGNTYTANYVKKLFTQYNIVTHFHSIASLKSALNYNIPTVVLIRNPEDAISSSVLKRTEGIKQELKISINYDIDEYINYYSFVKNHSDQLIVVCFQTAVNAPYKIVETLSNILRCNLLSEDKIIKIIEEVKKEMNNDKRIGGDRNMSTPYKEKRKKQLKKFILENEKFKKCNTLYNELKKKCI